MRGRVEYVLVALLLVVLPLGVFIGFGAGHGHARLLHYECSYAGGDRLRCVQSTPGPGLGSVRYMPAPGGNPCKAITTGANSTCVVLGAAVATVPSG